METATTERAQTARTGFGAWHAVFDAVVLLVLTFGVDYRTVQAAYIGPSINLGLFDLPGTLVLLDAVAGEYLHVDHGAVHAGGHAQGGVLHVRGFFTKDGTEELFLRRLIRFTLGRYLTDEDIALFDPSEGLPKLVVCFLAILELAREGMVRLTQQAAFSPIYVQAGEAS